MPEDAIYAYKNIITERVQALDPGDTHGRVSAAVPGRQGAADTHGRVSAAVPGRQGAAIRLFQPYIICEAKARRQSWCLDGMMV